MGFPDCMAFEVEDQGRGMFRSGTNVFSGRGAACYFKSSFTQLTDSYEQDCYTNTLRQGRNAEWAAKNMLLGDNNAGTKATGSRGYAGDSMYDFSKYEDDGLLLQAHALFTSHMGDRTL